MMESDKENNNDSQLQNIKTSVQRDSISSSHLAASGRSEKIGIQYCFNCRLANPSDINFCTGCGNLLNNEETLQSNTIVVSESPNDPLIVGNTLDPIGEIAGQFALERDLSSSHRSSIVRSVSAYSDSLPKCEFLGCRSGLIIDGHCEGRLCWAGGCGRNFCMRHNGMHLVDSSAYRGTVCI